MATFMHPFEQLEKLEQSAARYSVELPDAQSDVSYWNGVSFVLNKLNFVVQIGEIAEILPVPDTTPLPGVHTWAKGVANVRGRLIPIVDLGEFLGRQRNNLTSTNRIMIIERKDLSVGLIIDEVQGMVQLSNDSYQEKLPAGMPGDLQPFTSGCFQGQTDYVVFSVNNLLQYDRFLMVANS